MGDWNASLFGCCNDLGLCCKTYFCPCVVAGENAERARLGSCCTYGFLSMLGPIGLYCMAKTRSTAREQHNIEGSFCKDCLISWCCPFCSLIQVNRQLSTPGNMGQSMARV